MEGFKDDHSKSNQQTLLAKKVTRKVKALFTSTIKSNLHIETSLGSYHKYIEPIHEQNTINIFKYISANYE